MFNKKKQKEKESNLVKCSDCKYMIERADAQFIEGSANQVFCPQHRKKYQFAYIRYPFTGFDGIITYSKFEVDENGDPVGYQKKKWVEK